MGVGLGVAVDVGVGTGPGDGAGAVLVSVGVTAPLLPLSVPLSLRCLPLGFTRLFPVSLEQVCPRRVCG